MSIVSASDGHTFNAVSATATMLFLFA
jgi:hypothetical protein